MPDTAKQANWLTRIGAMRDGLLVLVSLAYGLGYLVWSLHAWNNGFGLLSALDAQYFAAGIIPGLVIVAAFYAFRLITGALEQLLTWLHADPKTLGKAVTYWGAHILAAISVVLVILKSVSGDAEYLVSWEWAGPVLIIAMLLGSVLTGTARSIQSKWDRLYRLFQVGNMTFGAAVVAVAYFIGSIYPHVPQELGGVSPRCAYLDLDKSLLSESTLSSLASSAEPASTSVVKSRRLDILYASSDVVMVRLGSNVFQLDREIIEAIASCDDKP